MKAALRLPHRCGICSRILFLTDDGVLPAHRKPQQARRMPIRGQFGSVALTGPDDKWCGGSGRPA